MKFIAKCDSIKKVEKNGNSFYVLKTKDDKIGICVFAPYDEALAKKFEEIVAQGERFDMYELTIRYGAYKAKDGSYGRCFRIVDIYDTSK